VRGKEANTRELGGNVFELSSRVDERPGPAPHTDGCSVGTRIFSATVDRLGLEGKAAMPGARLASHAAHVEDSCEILQGVGCGEGRLRIRLNVLLLQRR
jgi:hypothetical protein